MLRGSVVWYVFVKVYLTHFSDLGKGLIWSTKLT